MSLHRGIDGPSPLEPEPVSGPPGLHEERLARRSTRLAAGSLACPDCDAPPLAPGAPISVSASLACGYCGRTGPVRDFLILGEPTRPTRVVVHVRAPVSRPGGPRRR
ncbi:MAG: hypothetical protein JHC84_21340 [Solirubrobacteraceae bacterium]|nr:hypothetical protein [Solirubrobacteraceae bacterium]